MPSPFPGMNPYLEQPDVWVDFHHRFIARCSEELDPLVGPNYFVQVEVRVYLHELSGEERRFFGRADAGIATRKPPEDMSVAVPDEADSPVQLRLPNVDTEKHSLIEIRDRRDRRLVTVIELLSPSNKTQGPDRDDYIVKRTQYFEHGASLVEIDLRRGGVRPGPPVLPACDYYALVAPGPDLPRMGFWPIALRDRLPKIPVPLALPDRPVMLDLQSIVDRVYDAAGYAKYIYDESPEPPLSPDDAGWAKKIVGR